MTKPKTEAKKRKDRMGRIHNKIVAIIIKSDLTMPEVYVILDSIKQSLLNEFRKATINGSG